MRPSRSAIRHDDGPIPSDLADATRIGRERLSRWLAWIAIALVVMTFGAGLIR